MARKWRRTAVWKAEGTATGRSRPLYTACLRPTGDGDAYIVASGEDGSLELLRFSSGASGAPGRLGWIGQLSGEHGKAVVALDSASSQRGERIVSAGRDRHAVVWDAASGKPIRRLHGHDSAHTGVALLGGTDPLLCVTTGVDGTSCVWDLRERSSRRPLQRLGPFPDALSGISWSPNGKALLFSCLDGGVRRWDLRSGRLASLQLGGPVHAVAPDPSGELAACVCSTAVPATAASARSFVGEPPDASARVRVVDTVRGCALLELPGMQAGHFATSCRFTPTGRSVVAASAGGVVLAWNALSGGPPEELGTGTPSHAPAACVVVHPDAARPQGALCVGVFHDGCVAAWESSEAS